MRFIGLTLLPICQVQSLTSVNPTQKLCKTFIAFFLQNCTAALKYWEPFWTYLDIQHMAFLDILYFLKTYMTEDQLLYIFNQKLCCIQRTAKSWHRALAILFFFFWIFFLLHLAVYWCVHITITELMLRTFHFRNRWSLKDTQALNIDGVCWASICINFFIIFRSFYRVLSTEKEAFFGSHTSWKFLCSRIKN